MAPKLSASTMVADVQRRLEQLRRKGIEPIEVVLSSQTWEQLKTDHRGHRQSTRQTTRPTPISGRELFGVRLKLVPGTEGCVIRYFGGTQFHPDQAVLDGLLTSSKMVPRKPARPTTRDG